jgi:hypothetical protein
VEVQTQLALALLTAKLHLALVPTAHVPGLLGIVIVIRPTLLDRLQQPTDLVLLPKIKLVEELPARPLNLELVIVAHLRLSKLRALVILGPITQLPLGSTLHLEMVRLALS